LKFFRSEIFEQGSALPRYNVDLVKLLPIFYWLTVHFIFKECTQARIYDIARCWGRNILVTGFKCWWQIQHPWNSPTWELFYQHHYDNHMNQVEINPGISISIKKIVGEMSKLLNKKKCMRLTGNHEQYTFFIVQHFIRHNLDDLSLRTFRFLTRRSFDLLQFAS